MEHQTETDDARAGTDDGSEFVLDNRKLVFVFFGFLAICGFFFVLGYIMGNKPPIMGNGAAQPPINYADAGAAAENSNINDKPPAYNRMNETVSKPAVPPSAVTEPTVETPKAAVPGADIPRASAADNKPKSQPKETQGKTARTTATKQAVSTRSVYSVQVAAFRARREAEVKAKELEAKGFKYRIELPQTFDDYYRLRVGGFATRAEAAEMAGRLKKSGFEAIIIETKGN